MSRESDLEQENFALRQKLIEYQNIEAKERRSFWLELVKMLLAFFNPIVTAGAVYLSYSLTNAKIEQQAERTAQIELKVDENKEFAKTAAAEVKTAAEQAKVVAEETKSAISGLKSSMDNP